MSHITIIRLANPGDARSPLELVHSTVARADLALSDRLHTDTGPKPFSVVRRRETVDVVAFGDDLATALLRGDLAARLVTRVDVASLQCDGVGDRIMRLVCETPTHFRIHGLDHLVPDPFHLFGGLLDRWRALGWPELEPPDLRLIPVSIDRYLRRSHLSANGRSQSGFLAQLWLDLVRVPEADRMTLWTLARFGEYRGIGAHTSYGMGRMRLLAKGERWEPGRCLSCWDAHHEREAA